MSKQFGEYITVYEPEDERVYGGEKKPAQVNWSAIGPQDVANAREFLNKLSEAISYAHSLDMYPTKTPPSA